ncbi:unnamed protein product [Symbiodinium sp. CCMP2592]|nr:unnamed protein product [Symbiodinium sp. CCMP2592]
MARVQVMPWAVILLAGCLQSCEAVRSQMTFNIVSLADLDMSPTLEMDEATLDSIGWPEHAAHRHGGELSLLDRSVVAGHESDAGMVLALKPLKAEDYSPAELAKEVVPMLRNVVRSEFGELDGWLKEEVAFKKTVKFARFDITQNFIDFHNAGSLLQVALAAAGTMPCSVPIGVTLSNYADLVHKSWEMGHAFVSASVEAVDSHRVAILALAKNKPQIVMRRLLGCSALAQKMVDGATQMAEAVSGLVTETKQGLKKALEDRRANAEEMRNLKKQFADLDSNIAGMQAELEDLESNIADAKVEEENFARRADAARNKAQNMQMVGTIMGSLTEALTSYANPGAKSIGQLMQPGPTPSTSPAQPAPNKEPAPDKAAAVKSVVEPLSREVSQIEEKLAKASEDDAVALRQQLSKAKEALRNGYKEVRAMFTEQAKTLDDKEAAVHANRVELQKDRRKTNAELQKSLVALSHLKEEKSEVAKSAELLNTVVKTLGKVQKTFMLTATFWKLIKTSYEKLASKWLKDSLEEAIELETLVPDLVASTTDWITLGSVNYMARLGMSQAAEHVDNILSDLPVKEAAANMVLQTAGSLAQSLQEDEAILQLEEPEKTV